MEFKFKHEKTGEIKSIDISESEIQELISDHLYDIIFECDCDPIGETNVVGCGCIDYLEGFRLSERDDN